MNRTAHAIRRWRWPAAAAATVLGAGAVVALLQPATSGYLDPAGTDPAGGRALADLVTARGQHVLRTAVPAAGDRGGRALEFITSPGLLTPAQLVQAARFPGDILLVDPTPVVLRALAPEISIVGFPPVRPTRPDCAAQPASLTREAALAGDTYAGGIALTTSDPAAQACYPADDSFDLTPHAHGYDLIRYADGARTITVLGSSAPLTNAYLAKRGDAALALNLLRAATEIVWLVPSPSAQPVGVSRARAGQRSFFDLVPWPVYLIAIQLGIAAAVAAAWRARRLGPLVAERLPVIVRAAETVEGHGRLYQSLRARDRAAEELRAAASDRIARLTDAAADPEAVAARVGQAPAEVAGLLHGPPPKTDEALVTLAADLDNLMRKIRQS